jgi:hypothetical protein
MLVMLIALVQAAAAPLSPRACEVAAAVVTQQAETNSGEAMALDHWDTQDRAIVLKLKGWRTDPPPKKLLRAWVRAKPADVTSCSRVQEVARAHGIVSGTAAPSNSRVISRTFRLRRIIRSSTLGSQC